jgi:hypothetical protein
MVATYPLARGLLEIAESSSVGVCMNVQRLVRTAGVGVSTLVLVIAGTACTSDRDRDDRRLRDDLGYAANRQQYVSPQELQGYAPPAYASPYGAPQPYPYPPQYAPPPGYGYPPPYPYPYPPQPAPQQVVRERVVYRTVRVPAAPQRASSAPVASDVGVADAGGGEMGGVGGSGAGAGAGQSGGGIGEVISRPNTRKGAVIGATSGAVIGAATSRDRFKGAVVGAILGGAAGGVIGSQVRTRERTPEFVRVSRPRGEI